MIAIINRGGPADGVCTYTVGINKLVIATFKHDRRDGLEECLRSAADAVRDAEWRRAYEMIMEGHRLGKTTKPRI